MNQAEDGAPNSQPDDRQDDQPHNAMSPSDLQRSLDNDWFEALFQPLVRIQDGRAVAMEALARLNHPKRGTIAPDDFVPQIEDAGLALRLADQVTRYALVSLPPGFLADNALTVAVNLPLDVLLQESALRHMDRVRRECQVPLRCLSIELTESQPVTDIDSLRMAIHRWRDAGYDLALDDVGPEMPKHRALLLLPFSTMKLDRGAVLAAREDEASYRFVAETIEQAKKCGMAVVAEGVEDMATWAMVRDLGADQVQGFLVSRPIKLSQVPNWLSDWHDHRAAAIIAR